MKVLRKGCRITGAAAVLLAALIILSGCSIFKPKLLTITSKMVKKVEKVTSVEVTADVQSEFEIVYESINIGMNGSLNSNSVTEMTKDPARSKQDNSWSIEALGKKLDIKTEQYTDKADDGAMTVYFRQKGGTWSKKSMGSSAASEDEDKQESAESNGGGQESTSGGSGSGQSSSLQSITDLIGVLNDSLKDAELKKDLVTINDQEAYQINFTLDGNTLAALLDISGVDLSSIGLDTGSVDLDGIEVPSELYVYKKSGLPARIKADCTALVGRIVEDKLEEKLVGTVLSGVKLEFRSFMVDMTFDRYDEISSIEIPSEALNAEEGDSLESVFSSFLELF